MQALEEADVLRSRGGPNKILQFNDFGLVAITRKRVKQSLERTCCARRARICEGAGYVKSVQTVIGEIMQEAHKIARAVERLRRVEPAGQSGCREMLKSSDNEYWRNRGGASARPVLVIGDATLQQEKFDLV